MQSVLRATHRTLLFAGFLITCTIVLPLAPVVALTWLLFGARAARALTEHLCALLTTPFPHTRRR